MSSKVRVRLEVELDVTLPVALPLGAVNKYGVVIDKRFREAAIHAALGSMRQSCEVDVSGDLGIPFHTSDVQGVCSLARVFNQVTDSDVLEVVQL